MKIVLKCYSTPQVGQYLWRYMCKKKNISNKNISVLTRISSLMKITLRSVLEWIDKNYKIQLKKFYKKLWNKGVWLNNIDSNLGLVVNSWRRCDFVHLMFKCFLRNCIISIKIKQIFCQSNVTSSSLQNEIQVCHTVCWQVEKKKDLGDKYSVSSDKK